MSSAFFNPLSVPVLGFCAYSGTGKTTLLKQLIPELTHRGVRLAVVKHAHHNFDVDIPGKDSYEIRHAGARQVLVASHVRWALMTEDEVSGDPQLPHLLKQIAVEQIDMVLVEGFKKLNLPKIELHRAACGKPFIYSADNNILAVACCDDTQLPKDVCRLDINNIPQIADFVQQYAESWQSPNRPFVASCGCEHKSQSGLSVTQGIEHILQAVTPISDQELLDLDEMDNRLLAEDIISPINVPQHDNSAMDGYAFALSQLSETQQTYQLVGEILAGHSFEQELKPSEAVRIMTGAPIPADADTVVPKELAQENNHQVCFTEIPTLGQHIRLAGEDIAKGAIVLKKGQRMGPAEQGLLASLGMAQARVIRKPLVAVFSTGDEVSQPGTSLVQSCIYDANRFTIKSVIRRLGCEVLDLGIIPDSEQALEQALFSAAQKADVIISSGGVSVGNADFIKTVLERIGKINFWRINMRPGRPLAFGEINNALFFGLPGNPVAVMISLLQFVQPALRKLAGENHWQVSCIPAITDIKLRSRQGRTEFLRGIYHLGTDGQLHVRTTGAQGSGMLSSMVQGNCLIVIGEEADNISVGQQVTIQPFADLL